MDINKSIIEKYEKGIDKLREKNFPRIYIPYYTRRYLSLLLYNLNKRLITMCFNNVLNDPNRCLEIQRKDQRDIAFSDIVMETTSNYTRGNIGAHALIAAEESIKHYFKDYRMRYYEPTPVPWMPEPTPMMSEPIPVISMPDEPSELLMPKPTLVPFIPEPTPIILIPEEPSKPLIQEPTPVPLMPEPTPVPLMPEPTPVTLMPESTPAPLMPEPTSMILMPEEPSEPLMSEPTPVPLMPEPTSIILRPEEPSEPLIPEPTSLILRSDEPSEPLIPEPTSMILMPEEPSEPLMSEPTPASLKSEPTPVSLMSEPTPVSLMSEPTPLSLMSEPIPEPESTSMTLMPEKIPSPTSIHFKPMKSTALFSAFNIPEPTPMPLTSIEPPVEEPPAALVSAEPSTPFMIEPPSMTLASVEPSVLVEPVAPLISAGITSPLEPDKTLSSLRMEDRFLASVEEIYKYVWPNVVLDFSVKNATLGLLTGFLKYILIHINNNTTDGYNVTPEDFIDALPYLLPEKMTHDSKAEGIKLLSLYERGLLSFTNISHLFDEFYIPPSVICGEEIIFPIEEEEAMETEESKGEMFLG